jgi:alpha-galactosidase
MSGGATSAAVLLLGIWTLNGCGTNHMNSAAVNPGPTFGQWAPTPPMGWNSWDCFGAGVDEAKVKANADFMAEHLRQFGWQFIVVDVQWYEPDARGWKYRPDAKLEMDGFGRLLPATNRFGSAAGGKGFAPLAAYVHAQGLKIGLHMMRGIPRQAVAMNTPILGTAFRAADIANTADICQWNGDMYGVDMGKPGAQAYYDSVFRQFADWGLDFVKVDDLSRPYHAPEIEAIRKAIDRSGRAMVLSTSPGATPLADARHIASHANMWRISDDFWDRWHLLKEQFQRCADWSAWCGGGHYPDADMLPMGAIRIGEDGHTRFTRDEQITMMTLWSISRSPLIFGGNLPDTDPFTLSLLCNPEVIEVDQHSRNGRQLWRHDDLIAWTADVPGSADKYLAVFNAQDSGALQIAVSLADLGISKSCAVRDLWKRADIGPAQGQFAPRIAPHGAGLYRLSPLDHSGAAEGEDK